MSAHNCVGNPCWICFPERTHAGCMEALKICVDKISKLESENQELREKLAESLRLGDELKDWIVTSYNSDRFARAAISAWSEFRAKGGVNAIL